jgi:3D-(3,5/4)-trihydroxycyclohexane-1,2-dione acylhydrolase (decyclizing)
VGTVRLTVAQAVVRSLANQYGERDGTERRLITGCWGIFGHGNVAGVAQALLEANRTRQERRPSADMPYHLARNEQGMVHAAVGYARTLNRTSRCCGAPRIPRATTSNTGTPAWATRSPARWGSRWQHRTARCSPSSATGRT